MIVAVSINHSGLYNFLLDTGTQITMVDPSLAAELHLNPQGSTVVVAGVGSHETASLTPLDRMAVGSHAVVDQKVVVYDLIVSPPRVSAFAASSARTFFSTSIC